MAEKEEQSDTKITLNIKSTKQKLDIEIQPSQTVKEVSAKSDPSIYFNIENLLIHVYTF